MWCLDCVIEFDNERMVQRLEDGTLRANAVNVVALQDAGFTQHFHRHELARRFILHQHDFAVTSATENFNKLKLLQSALLVCEIARVDGMEAVSLEFTRFLNLLHLVLLRKIEKLRLLRTSWDWCKTSLTIACKISLSVISLLMSDAICALNAAQRSVGVLAIHSNLRRTDVDNCTSNVPL